MNWRPSDRLAAGVLSLLLWFLVAASALYWYFRVSGGGQPVSAPLAGHALADHLYLVDPKGSWMMRFPAGLDPAGASKVKRDLERLMRASSSWDKAGRVG